MIWILTLITITLVLGGARRTAFSNQSYAQAAELVQESGGGTASVSDYHQRLQEQYTAMSLPGITAYTAAWLFLQVVQDAPSVAQGTVWAAAGMIALALIVHLGARYEVRRHLHDLVPEDVTSR